MARHRLSTAFTLLTGAAGGFLAAVLLQDGPAPEPESPRERAQSVAVRPIVPASTAEGMDAENPAAVPSSLAGILRLDGEFEQTAVLYQLLRTVGVTEVERLIDEARGLADGNDRRAALSILYTRYADLDPEAALADVLERGGSLDQVETRALFHAWARRDVDAAVAAAASLPAELRSAAGIAILLAREDLGRQAQHDIAARLDIEPALAQITTRQVLAQVEQDPAAAWQAALSDEGGAGTRRQRLTGVVHAWAQQDPAAAMVAVTALPDAPLRARLQLQVIAQWGRQDPQAAVNWALSQVPSPERTRLMAAALSTLAEFEPRHAFDVAQSLSGRERAEALGEVLSRWAQEDPVAAAQSVALVSERDVRSRAILNVASAYASHDPQGALDWLSGLDVEEGSMAVGIVFHHLTRRDPAQGAELINRLSGEVMRRHAAAAVASVWAQQDPSAAARWTGSLTDDAVRAQATTSLLHGWMSHDREGALRYAQSLPAAAERDAAVVAVMQASQDSALNVRLFEDLTDPDQRRMAARLLYFTFASADPQRAEHYREIAGIPPGTGQ